MAFTFMKVRIFFDKFYGMTYLWKGVINRINKKNTLCSVV